MKVNGRYRDVLMEEGQVIDDKGWMSNSITVDFGRFLAAIMKMQWSDDWELRIAVGKGSVTSTTPKADADIQGFKNNIIESLKAGGVHKFGTDGWVWTKLIDPSINVTYLDALSKPIDTITNSLQITINFGVDEPPCLSSSDIFDFEEFSVLGRKEDSNDVKDVFLFNCVKHGGIFKPQNMRIERTIVLTFPLSG